MENNNTKNNEMFITKIESRDFSENNDNNINKDIIVTKKIEKIEKQDIEEKDETPEVVEKIQIKELDDYEEIVEEDDFNDIDDDFEDIDEDDFEDIDEDDFDDIDEDDFDDIDEDEDTSKHSTINDNSENVKNLKTIIEDVFLKTIANYFAFVGIIATIGLVFYLFNENTTVFGIVSIILFVLSLSLLGYTFISNKAYVDKSKNLFLISLSAAIIIVTLISVLLSAASTFIILIIVAILSVLYLKLNLKRVSNILNPVYEKLNSYSSYNNVVKQDNKVVDNNSVSYATTNNNIDPKTLLFNKTMEILNVVSKQDRSEQYYVTIFNNNSSATVAKPISIVFSSKNIHLLSINYNTTPTSINIFTDSFNFFRNYNMIETVSTIELIPTSQNNPKLLLSLEDSFKFINLFINNQNANNKFYEYLKQSKKSLF